MIHYYNYVDSIRPISGNASLQHKRLHGTRLNIHTGSAWYHHYPNRTQTISAIIIQ